MAALEVGWFSVSGLSPVAEGFPDARIAAEILTVVEVSKIGVAADVLDKPAKDGSSLATSLVEGPVVVVDGVRRTPRCRDAPLRAGQEATWSLLPGGAA